MRPYRHTLSRTLLGLLLGVAGGNLLGDALQMRWMTPLLREDLMVLNLYSREEHPVDVVFAGSSHTEWGIQPPDVEQELAGILGREVRVWNLGFPAGTGLAAPVIAGELFHGGRVPRVLVLEGDPLYWSSAVVKMSWASQYWRHFARLSEVLSTWGTVPRHLSATGLRKLNWGWENLWQVPARFISKGPRHTREMMAVNHGGRWWEVGIDPENPGEFRESPAMQASLTDPSDKFYLANPEITRERSLRSLEEVAGICRQRGVELVLLNFPVMDVAQDMNAPGAYEAFLATMQAECERLGILYRDENLPQNRARENFYDIDHLAPLAARNFSRRIARELLAPLLAE